MRTACKKFAYDILFSIFLPFITGCEYDVIKIMLWHFPHFISISVFGCFYTFNMIFCNAFCQCKEQVTLYNGMPSLSKPHSIYKYFYVSFLLFVYFTCFFQLLLYVMSRYSIINNRLLD